MEAAGDMLNLMTLAMDRPCSKPGCCGRLPVLYRVEGEDGWRLGCSGFASSAPTLIATLHGWLDKNEVRDGK